MAKFYGSVGYAETVKTAPGVHEERIVEYPYYGDLTRNARQLQSSETLNDDINVANEISICRVYGGEMEDHQGGGRLSTVNLDDWGPLS